jgi:hypothetical protein
VFASGEQLAVQLIGAVVIAAWSMATSAIMFLTLRHTIGLRVSDETESDGVSDGDVFLCYVVLLCCCVVVLFCCCAVGLLCCCTVVLLCCCAVCAFCCCVCDSHA